MLKVKLLLIFVSSKKFSKALFYRVSVKLFAVMEQFIALNSFLFVTNLSYNSAVKMRTEKKSSRKKIVKQISLALLLIVITLLLWQHKLVYYGYSQAKGQLSILWNAKPIEEIMVDPAYPDSLKAKIQLVQEIREFAFDSLGLNRNDNYTTFYDQGGKPILWVVTGCEPYQLKAKEWTFPILGTVSYKGFFDRTMATEEEKLLADNGFETSIGEVEGWSTLGWFKDPILSNMLERQPGSLANLIIHELTHGTLYVKNDVPYNENLASFIGDKGAIKFLEYKYGIDSPERHDYIKRRELIKDYSANILNTADRLDSLYSSFPANMSLEAKKVRKDAFFAEVRGSFKELLSWMKDKDPKFYEMIDSINNTYFVDVRRYRQNQDVFEKEFTEKFNSDFKAYFEYLKDKYPSL